ncbi:MAG: hypothetical protein QF790_10710 [Gammaproteobacteria bacterium]|jgi:hypothetical protein|nr:hypothetical protein [Gammaproteobacteria bacterium]MDP6617625.1 hypothetical protein [Gammaproteobacteria bacterium]MDP6694502.1 hypothetical protein [Gammaproteobacteria bacterium]
MPQKHPDSSVPTEIAEIVDINREFLRLLADPRLAGTGGALGLDEATLSCLRQLNPGQLENIATAPLLLAEFGPFPGGHPADDKYSPRNDRMVADENICADWQRELVGFANRLLTFVWQATRHDPVLSAFCLGLDKSQALELAKLGFSGISRSGDSVAAGLHARLSLHPTFWPDLIRSVRNGSREQQLASQLAAIQLSIIRRFTPAARTREPRYF